VLDVVTTKLKQRVLAATVLSPDREWYLHELARHLDAQPSSVQHELKLFASAGLLTSRKHGNRVYYRADRSSPAFAPLYELLVKTAGIADVIRAALKPLAKKIHVAFIYGSVAAGTELSASDVDLMIIGEAEFSEVTVALRKADTTIGRDINPTVYPTQEFRKKVRSKAHFVSAVLKTPLLFIYGTRDDLAGITGRPSDSHAPDERRGAV
jgi:DNA-binding transcriptional ArsR family regulator